MTIIDNFATIFTSKNFYLPLIVILVAVMIGHYGNDFIKGFNKVTLFKIGDSEFDLWSLSHVLLYVYFGYFFPEFFLEFLIIGSLWELYESTFCSKAFLKFFNCNNTDPVEKKNLLCKLIGNINNCGYWYGKLEDIPCNMLGFVIGALLSKKYRS